MTTTKPTDKTMARLANDGLLPSVTKILKTYRKATEAQIAAGLDWYGVAHSLALGLDPANPLRAAGVISALSVQKDWDINVALAVRAYADGVATGHTGAQCGKANAIMAGADVVKELGGKKTQNFALVIANPADPHAVVVDRHAVSIAIGRLSTDDDTKILTLKGVYDLYADAYREAARRAGVSPSQMQAVTWVVWRLTETKFRAANNRKVSE